MDRFDALRDSIVAHLEQVQLQLHADIERAIQGVEARLHEEFQGVEARLHEEIQGVEARLHEDILGVEARLHEDILGVEGRLTSRLDSVDARLDSLESKVDLLRAEIAERFESVDQRFRAMDLRMTLFENKYAAELAGIRTAIDTLIPGELEQLTKQVATLSASVARLNARLDPLETAVSNWAASTAGLGEDVKQRFRVMNDRLAGIEQRLAA